MPKHRSLSPLAKVHSSIITLHRSFGEPITSVVTGVGADDAQPYERYLPSGLEDEIQNRKNNSYKKEHRRKLSVHISRQPTDRSGDLSCETHTHGQKTKISTDHDWPIRE